MLYRLLPLPALPEPPLAVAAGVALLLATLLVPVADSLSGAIPTTAVVVAAWTPSGKSKSSSSSSRSRYRSRSRSTHARFTSGVPQCHGCIMFMAAPIATAVENKHGAGEDEVELTCMQQVCFVFAPNGLITSI